MRRVRPVLVIAALLLALPAAVQAANPPRSVLFAVDADSGGLTPVHGAKHTYRLTLEGVDGRAVAFDDRPARSSRPIVLQRMIDKLFAHGQAPPNAAVNATLSDGRQALMPVELGAPRYSLKSRTLTFVVRALRYQGDARHKETVTLPRRFGATALFIDNCCTAPLDDIPVYVFNTSDQTIELGVNFGANTFIAGTGAFMGWGPTSNGGITFSPDGAGQGVLSYGNNYLTVQDGSQEQNLAVSVPSGTPVASLQLYLFYAPATGLWHYSLLNNGELIASG